MCIYCCFNLFDLACNTAASEMVLLGKQSYCNDGSAYWQATGIKDELELSYIYYGMDKSGRPLSESRPAVPTYKPQSWSRFFLHFHFPQSWRKPVYVKTTQWPGNIHLGRALHWTRITSDYMYALYCSDNESSPRGCECWQRHNTLLLSVFLYLILL